MQIKLFRVGVVLFSVLMLVAIFDGDQTNNQNKESHGDTPVASTSAGIADINANDLHYQNSRDSSEYAEVEQKADLEKVSDTEPVPIEVDSGKEILPQVENYYKVVSVVDGDTVKLDFNGQIESVRLIGLDTPETVHPSKPVECFGIEASNKAKEILENKTVRFEIDKSQGERDKYGRLLGYIFLADGRNYNKLMIEEGYAYEYTYSIPYEYQIAFKEAENRARESKVGLWADGVCVEYKKTSQQNTQISPTGTETSNGKWYVSSHYSSRYYYCEDSDVWKGLSDNYLRVYESEVELLVDFPNHILHYSC